MSPAPLQRAAAAAARRPQAVHLQNALNPRFAACSVHARGPLAADPRRVTCRTCLRQLPARLRPHRLELDAYV